MVIWVILLAAIVLIMYAWKTTTTGVGVGVNKCNTCPGKSPAVE